MQDKETIHKNSKIWTEPQKPQIAKPIFKLDVSRFLISIKTTKAMIIKTVLASIKTDTQNNAAESPEVNLHLYGQSIHSKDDQNVGYRKDNHYSYWY